MEKLLQIGIISSIHGIRGEVKVFPTTDDVQRFKKGLEVYLDNGKENMLLKIDSVKFFKQFAIVKFETFNSINEIEKYKGASLFVTRENAVKCQKDEYFITDLIGLKVVDETGSTLGVLEDVLETGANDVYVVRFENGKEVLLPAIKQCILDINIEKGEMKVTIMEGLLE